MTKIYLVFYYWVLLVQLQMMDLTVVVVVRRFGCRDNEADWQSGCPRVVQGFDFELSQTPVSQVVKESGATAPDGSHLKY